MILLLLCVVIFFIYASKQQFEMEKIVLELQLSWGLLKVKSLLNNYFSRFDKIHIIGWEVTNSFGLYFSLEQINSINLQWYTLPTLGWFFMILFIKVIKICMQSILLILNYSLEKVVSGASLKIKKKNLCTQSILANGNYLKRVCLDFGKGRNFIIYLFLQNHRKPKSK